jgi:sugar phosphate isomerase/epimerase
VFSTLAPLALPLSVPFDRQLALARDGGFQALDLPVRQLSASLRVESPQRIAERFTAAGVRSGGWQLPFEHQSDGDRWFLGRVRRLARVAWLASQLDSRWCYHWIEPASDELTFAANTARHVARLRPIADVLAEHGCRLGLEPIGPRTLRVGRRHAFVHSIPMALELLAAIDRPNVGLLVDCYHWYTSGGTLAEVQVLDASQVVYVHVNDAPAGVDVDQQLDDVRLLPGASGVIDLVGFLRALDRIGYAGPVAVEPFDAALARVPPAERVRLAAESLRSAGAAAGITLVRPSGA